MDRRAFMAQAGAGALLSAHGWPSIAQAPQQAFDDALRRIGALAARTVTEADWSPVWTAVAQLNRSFGRPDQVRLADYATTAAPLDRLGAVCVLFHNQPSVFEGIHLTDALASAGNFAQARAALGYTLKTWQGHPDIGKYQHFIDDWSAHVAIKTYRLEYHLDPVVCADYYKHLKGDTWCPIPLTGLPYQTSTYTVSGAKATEEVLLEGNLCLRITPDGTNPIHFQATVILTPIYFGSRLLDFTEQDLQPEVQPFLKSRPPTMDLQQPVVQTVAAKLKGATKLETIENVFRWGANNQLTGKAPPANRLWLDDLLTTGTAACESNVARAVGLLRALGVPARFVRGHSVIPVGREGAVTHPTYHSWVDYYVPSVGWLQQDGDWMYASPPPHVIGQFRHLLPMAVKDGWTDAGDLWNFSGLTMRPRTNDPDPERIRCTLLSQVL